MFAHAVDESEFARVACTFQLLLPFAVDLVVHLLLAQLDLGLVGHLWVHPLVRVTSFSYLLQVGSSHLLERNRKLVNEIALQLLSDVLREGTIFIVGVLRCLVAVAVFIVLLVNHGLEHLSSGSAEHD